MSTTSETQRGWRLLTGISNVQKYQQQFWQLWGKQQAGKWSSTDPGHTCASCGGWGSGLGAHCKLQLLSSPSQGPGTPCRGCVTLGFPRALLSWVSSVCVSAVCCCACTLIRSLVMSCSPQNASPTSPLSPSWPMFSAPSSPMPTSSTSSDSSPIRSVAQFPWLLVAFALPVEFPRFSPAHLPSPGTLPSQHSTQQEGSSQSPRGQQELALLARLSSSAGLLCSAAGKKCPVGSLETLPSLVFCPQDVWDARRARGGTD